MLNAPFAGHSTSADGSARIWSARLTRSRDGSPLTAKRGVDLILGGLPARPGVCGMLRHAGVAHSARTWSGRTGFVRRAGARAGL